MGGRFIDRDKELATLDRRFDEGNAELLVLYGRRRVGKSGLLRKFCEGKSHLFFVGTRVREEDSLDAFRRVLQLTFGEQLLEHVQFSNWEAALLTLSRLTAGQRLVVVLDEFQYLCSMSPALPSVIQKWWDTEAARSKLMLVLCGSHIGFMESEVLAERSPLFGRRTGQLRLMPLLPWDAVAFFPEWSVRDRLWAYAFMGGIPAYLERVGERESLMDFILRDMLSTDGYLFDELSFLLRTELGHSHTYLSLLKAIASGNTRISEIAQKTGLSVTSVVRPLNLLIDLGFVVREVPFSERHPERSKRGRYYVADPLTAFWCRYILPWRSLVVAGQCEILLQDIIMADFPTYAGHVFEFVCREFIRHRTEDLLDNVHCIRVGRIWGRDFELDIVAELTDGTILVGECKAWAGPVGANVLMKLMATANKAGLPESSRPVLFSTHGFTPELVELSKHGQVILVSGEQILERPRSASSDRE